MSINDQPLIGYSEGIALDASFAEWAALNTFGISHQRLSAPGKRLTPATPEEKPIVCNTFLPAFFNTPSG